MSIKGKCNACCVPGCHSNSTPSFRNRGGRITTFKLPRNEKRRKEWIQAIPKRKYPPTVNHNVCILHFNEEDFSRNNRRIDLKKSAVPSIFPFVNGQRTDENTDICDELWTEYVAHKNDSLQKTLEDVRNEVPAPTSDITRILIERLRISGSKYFGIDTTEITIEPDSDIESDVCEPKATIIESDNFVRMKAKATKSAKKKNRKTSRCERERQASSDEFNVDNFDDIEMTDSQTTMEEHNDSIEVNHFPIEAEKANVRDNEDKFGAMVSSKLLLMSPLQRLLSEKIISEILFKGQLGMLKRSLSPVLVADYIKNVTNGVTTTTNEVPTDCSPSTNEGDNDKDDDCEDDDSDDCDPLRFQVKTINGGPNLETFEFVKDEIAWSDDD